ncbi:MAG: hypothetical protein AAGA20_17170 [Planctomycetota bacterium]
MRILSDFDGVWTDQASEARWIQRWFARAAADRLGIDRDEALADFDAFLSAALDDPAENGWAPRGLLTAFVDEDELLATGSVARWLDLGGEHPRADLWRNGVQDAGYDSVHALGTEEFEPAMRSYLARFGHRVVDGAREVVDALLASGVDLVIVSNSPTDKLEAMFGAAGVRESDGVRFVGGARKWWIESPEPIHSIAGRDIYLDRPIYRDVVAREQPDLVIGDVVSLDLAIPGALRLEGAISPDAQLVLRRGPRSSAWALSQPDLQRDARFVDEVVDDVADLVGIARRG